MVIKAFVLVGYFLPCSCSKHHLVMSEVRLFLIIVTVNFSSSSSFSSLVELRFHRRSSRLFLISKSLCHIRESSIYSIWPFYSPLLSTSISAKFFGYIDVVWIYFFSPWNNLASLTFLAFTDTEIIDWVPTFLLRFNQDEVFQTESSNLLPMSVLHLLRTLAYIMFSHNLKLCNVKLVS